jgi:probable O-glycosylation ligase (exosortase A-associated)
VLVFLGALLIAVPLGQLVADESPRVAMGFFVCLLMGGLILMVPFAGIVAYFIVAFLRPDDVFWGLNEVPFSYLASASTAASALVHMSGSRPSLAALRKAPILLLVVLWVMHYLSTVYGRFAAPEALWVGYYGKLFVIVGLMVLLVRTLRQLYVLAAVIALSVGYLGYWANEKYFLHGWWVVRGPGGTFKDQNDFAMLMVMAIPFMWEVMRRGRPTLVRLGALVALPLVGHGIMVTYSRGGFLGMLGVLGYAILRERNRRVGLLLAGAAAAFWVLFAGDAYRERIGTINDYESDGSATGRLASWDVGMRMATDNPWFGVGLKRYVAAYPYYDTAGGGARVAHNSWVQLAAESGLVAVACYALLMLLSLASLIRVALRARRLPEDERRLAQLLGAACEGALLGYIVCGFFLSMEDMEFFYLLVGMVLILDHVTRAQVDALEAAERRPVPAPERRAALGAPRLAFPGAP